MVHKLRTALRILRQNGIKGLIRTVAKKIFPDGNFILSWNSRVLLVSRVNKNECSRKEIFSKNASYKSVRLATNDLSRLNGLNGQTGKLIRAAIERKENCWVIESNSILVSYVWISDEKEPISSDTGYLFQLKSTKGYWWRDAYICPKYRGQGLLQVHLNCWIESTDNLEFNLYTEVSPENIASIIAHKRLGFTTISKLKMLCILGLRMFYISGGPDSGFKFRFYPKSTYS